jgi:hypothetical protein
MDYEKHVQDIHSTRTSFRWKKQPPKKKKASRKSRNIISTSTLPKKDKSLVRMAGNDRYSYISPIIQREKDYAKEDRKLGKINPPRGFDRKFPTENVGNLYSDSFWIVKKK